MVRNKFLKYAIIVASIIAPVVTFYVWQILYTPNLNVKSQKDFYLLIPTKSATYETVLDSLHKHDMMNSEMYFRFLAKLLKYPEHVKPGRYRIRSNSGNYEIIKMLRSGDQTPVRLTFNNIRLKKDLVEKIGGRFEFDSLRFANLLNSDSVCTFYGFTPETIIAMFRPNTYEVYWNTTPQKFMGRMKSEYDKFWTDERKSQAKALGLTPVEVITLASIVEAETKKNDEKPRVAGVYLNHLAADEPLRADPTVIYAIGDFGIKRLLNSQLLFKSPYNTYINHGLPPGPINIPEDSSVKAVLNAEHHKYMYFCASPALNGYHLFAETYAEHLN
ncbi:MAG: endolytic transglycosylase MltG, partial [Siphonobacter sp.]